MRLEQKSTRQAGFSLIELLTVVTIIVVLSAIAYPNIAEYVRHYRLRGGTNAVLVCSPRNWSNASSTVAVSGRNGIGRTSSRRGSSSHLRDAVSAARVTWCALTDSAWRAGPAAQVPVRQSRPWG